jgi:hypothetical protein
MNKQLVYTVFFLLFHYIPKATAQVNCTVPLPPVLTSVSVDPETDKTSFTWLPSESTGIAAYIIYSYKGGDGQAIDTIWDPAATSHTITNTAPKYSSVSYVVAAHRLSSVPGMPGCTSPLSNVLSTIFCEARIDTCNKKIYVSWNTYPSEPRVVDGYTIFMSVNGSSFVQENTTGPDAVSFTLEDFTTSSEYCFYIRANLEGGTFSTSNKACVITNMQRAPDWINADYATVNSENRIDLSFTIDPMSDITHFSLGRRTDGETSFQTIANPESTEGSVRYTDSRADAGVVNYYRLSAINNCNIPVTFSNICSNIVLSLGKQDEALVLSWNPYRSWAGQVSDYALFINTGDGFREYTVINANDSTFTLNYRQIMYGVTGNEICMYLTASESSNPHGITGRSTSSVSCTAPVEIITVPNIFTPNNDLKNDLSGQYCPLHR